jgi:N-acyl-D-aspartate/D-glutamate deacylase
MYQRPDKIFLMKDSPDYEPPPSDSIAAIAKRQGCTPDEVAYDYLTGAPDRFLFYPTTGYVQDDHGPIREMLTDDATILGLADAGAHCSSIVDASVPTYMLTHWARDRSRGPRLDLEQVVKMQTADTASFFGFNDRGRLAPGMKADLNLIDFHRLRLHKPEIVYDLPAGGRRLVQRVDGYAATIVSGQVVFEDGVHTGAMPGQLVRNGRVN